MPSSRVTWSSELSEVLTEVSEDSESEDDELSETGITLTGEVSQTLAAFTGDMSERLGSTLEGLGDFLLEEDFTDSERRPRETLPKQASSREASCKQAPPLQPSRSSGGGSSSSSSRPRRPLVRFQAAARAVISATSLAESCSRTVDMPKLLQKVRGPFGRLIDEVRTPSMTSDHAVPAAATEAIVQVRLCDHVLACCEAAISDLSTEEARLWNAFISADTALTGTVAVYGGELAKLLTDCFGESDQLETWLSLMAEVSDENGHIDFADLLEWYTQDPEIEGLWLSAVGRLRASFAAGLGHFMNFAPSAPQMHTELVSELRLRCAKTAPGALAETAAAYERSLLLTKCWQCEHRLAAIVSSATNSTSEGGSAPQPVQVLLHLLRNIDNMLDPTERVLWEVIGSKNDDFEGCFTKQEVLDGIGTLLVYTLERELSTQSEDFEELQQLRLECQRQSVEGLFRESQLTVTISNVIGWWWDMPKEFRIAAGLTVPAALIRRSIHRKPEQMFTEKIRRVASNVSAANKSLHGHVLVYAELHALMVRRTIERLHYDNGMGPTSATDAEQSRCQ